MSISKHHGNTGIALAYAAAARGYGCFSDHGP